MEKLYDNIGYNIVDLFSMVNSRNITDMRFANNQKILNHCLKYLNQSSSVFAKNVELLDFSNNWIDQDTWPLLDELFGKIKNVSDLNLSSLEPGDFMYFEPKKIPQMYKTYTWGDCTFACLTNCMFGVCMR